MALDEYKDNKYYRFVYMSIIAWLPILLKLIFLAA